MIMKVYELKKEQYFNHSIEKVFDFLDPNKNLFLNLSYEKVISEANIMNYDYIADSYSFSFSKSFQLNK